MMEDEEGGERLKNCNYSLERRKKLSGCFGVIVHDGIKIPSRTIVLQAWVSSVVSPILKMGFFPNALS